MGPKSAIDELKQSLLMQEGVKEVSVISEHPSTNFFSVRILPNSRREIVDPMIKKCFYKELIRLKLKKAILEIYSKEAIYFDPPL